MAERRIDAERLVDQLVDAIVVADETGTVTLANQAAERLLGGGQPSLVGTPILSFIPERFRAAHQRGFDRFVATRRGEFVGGSSLQVAALRQDGTEVPIELTLGAVEHPDAGIAVVASIRDVSRRVVLERQAVLSRYLQATVEAAQEGVLAWSQAGRVLAVNRRFCEVWGIDPAQITVGADATDLSQHLVRMADPQPLLDALAAARENPAQAQTFEVLLRDGRLVEGYGAPITDVAGLMLGRVWYVHDETERRAAEEQRAALLSQLAEAQRAQRFLLDASAVLAHATGFAETLEALAQVAVPTLG
ncbi:MAG: PAS domain-containing protein, partial [Mycobacteriales bacterium]